MATVHEYKKLENSIVQKCGEYATFIVECVIRFFKFIFAILLRPYTVVFVPHSQKKMYSLQISGLFFIAFIGGIVFISWIAFRYVTPYESVGGKITYKDSGLENTQANLDELRLETARLQAAVREFETALSATLATLGTNISEKNAVNIALGEDLSTFFNIPTRVDGVLQEVEDIRQLSAYLSSAIEPVKEIGTILDTQSALLNEIPSIWPIKGGIGHVSMFFGQNRHPFTGQYYIHKGIDLSTYRQGDPIVATADGQVVTVDYDATGFGNYVIIKHKHGFYTRYAHMQSVKSKVGDRVQQGETIGYIGNTGLSTGPHVHYEVHIGSDIVDPNKYLNIRSNLTRSTR
ncbi:MAG: M23 family metallopeptidase [Treponema sp.]|jgi:murein DD-endopeptidase MepM/ murein hydrolase activator NlpD|nr:M23 family metallopeptidase [Treponema sp.]